MKYSANRDGALKNSGSLRLFYALWPDDAIRAALQRVQANIQGRKTSYGNLHITLAFLGQQPADLLPVLKQILAGLPQPDMTLTLDRVDYFRRSRIAWAGMREVPPALHALQQTLVQALLAHNIEFDQHSSFTPHVTLARDAPQPPDTPFQPIIWHAAGIALVQSVNGDGGVSYRVLASR